MAEIPEETKKMIAQFQSYQQQLQTIFIQKESLKLQMLEIERALKELDETKQKTAYKITGQIMISKPVEELKLELSETKENIDIRINSLEKSEKHISDKSKDLQTKLREVIK